MSRPAIAPFRRTMDYTPLGRQLLMVEELPQGALARYERDVDINAHITERRVFHIIRINSSSRLIFGHKENEFTIYGTKGISSKKCEYLLK